MRIDFRYWGAYPGRGLSPLFADEDEEIESCVFEMLQIDKCVGLIPITINYVKLKNSNAKFVVGVSWLKSKHLSSNAKEFKDFIITYYYGKD